MLQGTTDLLELAGVGVAVHREIVLRALTLPPAAEWKAHDDVFMQL